ncbi:copper homeostasis protein CutC [Evansella sp. LMS18]|uniref:copper homeostasis protein CutC n=1 Tax=Evansella sp. LMS18 TaxID=2924033 RepID=UPI0020D08D89|nr:copper homeostasis protein CutC [Evansella sp. LMS18]UTR10244.1 copper homeostasis protein CutC [Evansella sp. LMS18]
MMEWIVENKQDAVQAEKLGADRLELIASYPVGGVTPSIGLIRQVVDAVTIPVQVMVRPDAYSFVYTEDLKNVILNDIKLLKSYGLNRIVLGANKVDRTIDKDLVERAIEQNNEINITFHRAFDELSDLQKGYKDLIPYKEHVKRILTSGGSANCTQGLPVLKKLVQLQRETNGPVIMPGSGLNAETIGDIHQEIDADEYHFGTGVRIGGSMTAGFDPDRIENIRDVLKSDGKHKV